MVMKVHGHLVTGSSDRKPVEQAISSRDIDLPENPLGTHDILKVHAGQAGRWDRVSALWTQSIEGGIYFARLIFCSWGVNLSSLDGRSSSTVRTC
jgi:hypothetical protein